MTVKLNNSKKSKQDKKKESIKRPLNKDDFDFVLTGVTKPLEKDQDKKESEKT